MRKARDWQLRLLVLVVGLFAMYMVIADRREKEERVVPFNDARWLPEKYRQRVAIPHVWIAGLVVLATFAVIITAFSRRPTRAPEKEIVEQHTYFDKVTAVPNRAKHPEQDRMGVDKLSAEAPNHQKNSIACEHQKKTGNN